MRAWWKSCVLGLLLCGFVVGPVAAFDWKETPTTVIKVSGEVIKWTDQVLHWSWNVLHAKFIHPAVEILTLGIVDLGDATQ